MREDTPCTARRPSHGASGRQVLAVALVPWGYGGIVIWVRTLTLTLIWARRRRRSMTRGGGVCITAMSRPAAGAAAPWHLTITSSHRASLHNAARQHHRVYHRDETLTRRAHTGPRCRRGLRRRRD